MKSTWRYRDIIDLEYFIYQDKAKTSRSEQKEIRERDRRIYKDCVRQAAEDTENNDRRSLLFKWLAGRRKQEEADGGALLPGRLVSEIYVHLCLVFSVVGIFSGIGAGLSFFTYTGANPLNVFHYLVLFVFLQPVILLILLCSLTLRRRKRLPEPSLLASLVAGLVTGLFQRAGRRLLIGMSADKREGFLAILGVIKGKQSYSSLIFWPVLLSIQLFAVMFNLGLLSVTLFKVAVTDMAFGWQSTIQFSSEAIYHFVRAVALPWSWFIGSGISYPSLTEIEGSRIILKDGILHLSTGNLVSWWPFLCFALCTYGLLPRLVLLFTALYKKDRAIEGIQFDQAVFDRLLARMQIPIISTQAEPEQNPTPEPDKPDKDQNETAASNDQTGLTVLVPDDIFDRCPEAELKRTLAGIGNFPVKTIRFAADYETDSLLLRNFAASASITIPILILMEAWMPPITDLTVFLHDLRKALPKSLPIRIGLIGKPAQETIFTPVDTADFKTWQKKIDSMGDPYLSVENIV